MKKLLLASICVALAACAQSPEAIAPSYVSYLEYNDLSCTQMSEELLHLDYALASASDQQSAAHTGDALGVLFVGLPTSSMSGQNIAPEVARLKGHIEAAHEAMIRKNCTTELAVANRRNMD